MLKWYLEDFYKFSVIKDESLINIFELIFFTFPLIFNGQSLFEPNDKPPNKCTADKLILFFCKISSILISLYSVIFSFNK